MERHRVRIPLWEVVGVCWRGVVLADPHRSGSDRAGRAAQCSSLCLSPLQAEGSGLFRVVGGCPTKRGLMGVFVVMMVPMGVALVGSYVCANPHRSSVDRADLAALVPRVVRAGPHRSDSDRADLLRVATCALVVLMVVDVHGAGGVS